MVATLMVHPRIMKIHKNLSGYIPNIFPYQHLFSDWEIAFTNYIFVWISPQWYTLRLWKFTKICRGIPTFYSLIEKLHSQIIFCMVATLMIHPRIMKIRKNLAGIYLPNIFPYQHFILSLRNCIHKLFFVWSHPNGTS